MNAKVSQRLSFKGIGASPGIVVGKAFVLDKKRVRTPRVHLKKNQVDAELKRLSDAVDLSDQQLSDIKERLSQDGADHALILDAHRLMLRDPMLIDEAHKLIRHDLVNAEWAIRRVARKIKHVFDNIEDEYFRERRADVDFVADRLIRNLMGQSVDVDATVEVPADSVVVAHDITPADAAMLLKTGKVIGFLTDLGGQTSHTAIVARAREVAAVVGAGKASELIHPGDEIALDGHQGLVLVNPGPEQLLLLRETMRRLKQQETQALKLKDVPAICQDGTRVRLYGNMEFSEEIDSLLAHGAEGIGLFRTEFLFLERDSAPSEEEQYRYYRQVLEAVAPRPVTIRLLDLGGDKIAWRKHEKEPNPAMGLRAIRYCLAHRDLFRTQLRALLRASAHGNLRLMIPLVSGLSELRETRSEIEYVRTELGKAGVPLGKRCAVGIMVETPAAAWISDRLAQEADFFSIGTNDLIQYSMAIDRQNRDVAYLYRPLHLSVLRQIQHIVRAADAAGIPVSMCGEMAGDPVYTLVLLALGLHELSMSSGQIPQIKQVLMKTSRDEATQLLEAAMQFSTSEEIERFVRSEMEKRFSGNTES